MQPGSNIRNRRLAADGQAMHPELEVGLNLRQGLLGAVSAGERIGDNPDMMAALDLAIGEIEDMAKDSANRRAHGVQDTKRLIRGEVHE
jgi:hypothetical protein